MITWTKDLCILNMVVHYYFWRKRNKSQLLFFNMLSCLSVRAHHFWGHCKLVNTPSKRDFLNISENGHFGKYFDFAPSFLPSRINSNDKKQLFDLSLDKYIVRLMTKLRLFRYRLWRFDVSGWIWAKNIFENWKLTK